MESIVYTTELQLSGQIVIATAIAQISRLTRTTIENYISATKILPKNPRQTVDSHVIALWSVRFQNLSQNVVSDRVSE